jgi:hypothetical protein
MLRLVVRIVPKNLLNKNIAPSTLISLIHTQNAVCAGKPYCEIPFNFKPDYK